MQTDGANMRLQWSAILARKGHFMATRILNCLGGVGDEIESELPDQSGQVCVAYRERCGGDIIDALSALPILAPDLFGEFAGRKTEFKTIASKMIQHPAVTIERIRPRRRVIELSVQTRLSGAAV
ncbi:MAG: hypothetical protein WBF73_13515, partial [Bradyrhizobium sp.]